MAAEKAPTNAQLSADDCDWGTDPRWISHARKTLQRVDMDPASSLEFNQYIGATEIITRRQDFRRTPWMFGGPKPRFAAQVVCPYVADYHVIHNPPGDKRGELVAFGWRTLAGYFANGWISAAVFIGFSLEQLARLQRVGAVASPLDHYTIIGESRPKFRKLGVTKTQPTHAAFMTLLTRSRSMLARFADNDIGQIVRTVPALNQRQPAA